MPYKIPFLTSNVESFADIIYQRAQITPNKDAFCFLEKSCEVHSSYTYATLHNASSVIAKSVSLISKPGDRAILLYEPGEDYLISFFSCLYAGIIAVPVFLSKYSNFIEILKNIVDDCQATLILTTESNSQLLNSLKLHNEFMSNITVVATDAVKPDIHNSFKPVSSSNNAIAFLQYTSGSTGKPKGVMVTNANLLENSQLIYQAFEHNEDSKVVSWLPPYHDMGLIGGILQPLYGGFPAYLISPMDFLQKPFLWLKAISKYKATSSGGPNFAFELCNRKVKDDEKITLDLSSWQVAFNGAEPINSSTLENFSHIFKNQGFMKKAFFPCYGLAEATLFVSGGRKNDVYITSKIDPYLLEKNKIRFTTSDDGKEIVSSGRVWKEQRVKIVNPDTGCLANSDEVGEIWISGQSITKGYWQNQKLTDQAFNQSLPKDQERYFRTGDLGFIHEDQLYVTGRIKDVIIIRGRNIYPNDIEVLASDYSDFLRPGCCAAFSVSRENQSEVLIVVAEVKDPTLSKIEQKYLEQNLRQSVSTNLSVKLEELVLIKPNTIPKTSSGKLKRSLCKELFLSNKLRRVDS